MIGQMMMCTPCMCNYYLCEFYIEIIDNEKIRGKCRTNDDVYILHIKRYAIKTCSGLER
jgi:hypothetical protein